MSNDEEPADELAADLSRGHVRIWRNPRGDRRHSVTIAIGTNLEEAEAAMVVAEAIEDRLSARLAEDPAT